MRFAISRRDLWSCPWSSLVRLARALWLRVDDREMPDPRDQVRRRERFVTATERALAKDATNCGGWA